MELSLKLTNTLTLSDSEYLSLHCIDCHCLYVSRDVTQ
jgi:hypothetical protein